jgi:hypothetical protein
MVKQALRPCRLDLHDHPHRATLVLVRAPHAVGGVRGRPSQVPPALLARLREHKAGLAELLAGKACRRCGGAIADRGPDAWVPFADGTAAHMRCEDEWELSRLRARAEAALPPKVLADGAELVARGEPLP